MFPVNIAAAFPSKKFQNKATTKYVTSDFARLAASIPIIRVDKRGICTKSSDYCQSRADKQARYELERTFLFNVYFFRNRRDAN